MADRHLFRNHANSVGDWAGIINVWHLLYEAALGFNYGVYEILKPGRSLLTGTCRCSTASTVFHSSGGTSLRPYLTNTVTCSSPLTLLSCSLTLQFLELAVSETSVGSSKGAPQRFHAKLDALFMSGFFCGESVDWSGCVFGDSLIHNFTSFLPLSHKVWAHFSWSSLEFFK